MNKLTKQISEVALVLALLLFLSASARAQDQPSEAGQISNTLRSAAYPEAIFASIMPDWERGYVIHYEFEVNHSPDTPMVVMYDNTGKRIRE